MRNNKYLIDLNKGCCNLLLANHFQTWDPKLQVLVFLFLIREYRLLFTKYLILFVCFLISFESLSEKYMAFLCSYYRFDIKREKWKEIQNFNFFKFLRLFFFYYWLLVAVRFKSYLDSKGVLISKLRIFGRLIEYSSSIQIRCDFFMWINCAKRFQHYADVFQPSLTVSEINSTDRKMSTRDKLKKKLFVFHPIVIHFFVCAKISSFMSYTWFNADNELFICKKC